MRRQTMHFRRQLIVGAILSGCLAVMASTVPVPEPWELAPVVDAIRMGNQAAVTKFLALGYSANSIGPGDNPLLLEAVAAGQLGIVKLLIANGADPRAKGNETVAVVAVRQKRMDMLQCLVEAKAWVTKPPYICYPWDDILVAAARIGDISMVQYLLDHGADAKASGLGDTTALQVASGGGDIEIMRLLIAKGADVNHRECNGRTPLMIACEKGQVAAVEFLLAHGADPALTDGYGRSAEKFASEAKNTKVNELSVLCAGKKP
jgi:ankyrin repeat protein